MNSSVGDFGEEASERKKVNGGLIEGVWEMSWVNIGDKASFVREGREYICQSGRPCREGWYIHVWDQGGGRDRGGITGVWRGGRRGEPIGVCGCEVGWVQVSPHTGNEPCNKVGNGAGEGSALTNATVKGVGAVTKRGDHDDGGVC